MANKRFRVGTFNLYNLASPETKFYRGIRYTDEQHQAKTQWIAEQLRRIDGDIVGFQEIFDAAALQDALDQSAAYQDATVIVGETDGQKPVVGLVSRLPVLEYEFIPGFPQKAHLEINDMSVPCGCFSRPVLCARVEIRKGLEMLFFVVHLKSKNPIIRDKEHEHEPVERAIGKAKSLIVRTAEATALRCILLSRL